MKENKSCTERKQTGEARSPERMQLSSVKDVSMSWNGGDVLHIDWWRVFKCADFSNSLNFTFQMRISFCCMRVCFNKIDFLMDCIYLTRKEDYYLNISLIAHSKNQLEWIKNMKKNLAM